MKLAIQRLVRGDDGLTKVIYIDLGTLQQLTDLTGYRVVNSGDLYEEPVTTVDDPETPSQNPQNPAHQNLPPSRGENDGRNDPVPAPNQVVTPTTPTSPTGVTAPSAIRTPESRVPSVVSPPAVANPEAPSQVPADLGPLGGIRTVQGSILPSLDYSRFDQNLRDLSAPTAVSRPGNPNPSQLERTLESRNELENIKDSSAGIGNYTPPAQGTTIAGRQERVGQLPAAARQPAGTPTVGYNPQQTTITGRQEQVGSLPAARESVPDVSGVGIGRNAYDTSYGVNRGAINAGIMATDDMPTRPSDTISAQQAGLPSISRNAYDTQRQAEKITSGLATTVAGRPERVGTLPSAGVKMSPTMGTKDDFAGPVGTSMAGDAVFDRPSTSADAARSVAGKVVDAAKSPTSIAERTTSTKSGFVSAYDNPNQSKTTSFTDSAGYSQVDRSGNRGWRNNNPGNIEASNWTKSQPGYIGDDGRFAVFDSYENGVKAQAALLGTSSYATKTIAGAIAKYAPAFENNTAAYAAAVAAAIGVPVDTKMSDLTPAQRETMVDAMHEVEGSTIAGKQSVSLTSKGIAARDNYTGLGTGSDTPSEKNAASRPSSGTSFGAGGSRGVASNIGRNDKAGPGRGSSPGGPSISTGGIGRASSSTPSKSSSSPSKSSPARSSTGGIGSDHAASAKSSSGGKPGSEGASQRSGGVW